MEGLVSKELGWASILERPPVDEAFVASKLAPWPELRGRPWQRLGGGLRSINVRVGDVVARIGAGAVERALLADLDEVRAPRVIDASEDVLLLEYVPHQPLPATEAALGRVGAAAAAIHVRRFERPGLLDGTLAVAEPFSSAFEGLRAWAEPMLAGRAGERLGPLADAARAAWDAERSALIERPPVLVHADFKPMNVKWLPETEDVVIFDWEFAWAGAALFDVGQLFRWNPPDELVHAFADGYRAAGGELPEGWRRLSELFDLFNLVSFLDHPEACDRRVADSLERVRQTVRAR